MVNITPEDAIREYALMTLKFKALYSTVFENRVVKYFIRAVPSLAEFVTLGKIWFHEGERLNGLPRYDLIVIDAPATGHLISLLRVPRVFEEMIPAGPLHSSAQDFIALLENPRRTKLDVVTLPEEMPVNEALAITEAAQRFRFATRGLTIANRIPTELSKELVARATAANVPAPLHTLCEVIREQAHWFEVGERHLQKLAADRPVRLQKRDLPLFGHADLEAFSREFEQALVARAKAMVSP